MRKTTTLILVIILFVALFKPLGATLTNNVVLLAGMLLLLALFDDLKEFSFFGMLRGKKYDRDLSKLEDKNAINENDKFDTAKAQKVGQEQLQLMDPSQGNFLALAFEIERLLRIYATVSLGKDIPSNTNITKLTKELRQIDALTETGAQQIEAIRWLRNILVHGRQAEITQQTLDTAFEIARNLYTELNNTLFPQTEAS